MKTGMAILSLMAGIWAAWALHAARSAQWAYIGGAIVALVPLLLMMRRRFDPRSAAEARRIGRLVGLASFAEVVAIVGGVQILAREHRTDLIVCLIAAVVGLHFLPLARWMPMPRYYLSGLALLAIGCVGLAIPTDERTLIVAGAASAILWLTAVSLVLERPRLTPTGG